ncbi:MAG: flagellar biosynthetic protein FliO [Myxococcota bacterium]
MKTIMKLMLVVLLGSSGVALADPGPGSAEARLAAALASKVEQANELNAQKSPEPKVMDRSSYYQFGAISLLLACLAFVAAYLIRKGRRQGWLEGDSQDLAVQESVWIGKGQRLLLVAVGGQNVLVGATPQGLYGLGAFAGSGPRIEAPPAEGEQIEQEDPDEVFASMVKNELSRSAGARRDRRRAYDELRAL